MSSSLFLLGLLLVPLALWFLRKESSRSRQSAARTATLVFLMLMVVGLGLCGVAGAGYGVMLLFGGSNAIPYALLFGVPGLIGLTLAWSIYRATQRARHADLADEPPPSTLER